MLPVQQMFSAYGNSTPTDPYYASVVSLNHFDGVDGATSCTDQKGKTWTFVGAAQLDTARYKWGTAALLGNGTNAYISTPDNADFEFGSGDYTMECWVYFDALPTTGNIQGFFAKYSGASHAMFFGLYNPAGTVLLQWFADDNNSGQAININGAWTPSLTTWYHVAVSRTSGTTSIYANGNRINSGADAITYHNNANIFTIGAGQSGAAYWINGSIDDARVTKGVGRYSGATLTIPTAAFPNS